MYIWCEKQITGCFHSLAKSSVDLRSVKRFTVWRKNWLVSSCGFKKSPSCLSQVRWTYFHLRRCADYMNKQWCACTLCLIMFKKHKKIWLQTKQRKESKHLHTSVSAKDFSLQKSQFKTLKYNLILWYCNHLLFSHDPLCNMCEVES